MKSNLGVLAAAALLAEMVATNAMAAGRGGGTVGSGIMESEVGAGGFRGGEPFLGTVPSTPPIFNPSSPQDRYLAMEGMTETILFRRRHDELLLTSCRFISAAKS